THSRYRRSTRAACRPPHTSTPASAPSATTNRALPCPWPTPLPTRPIRRLRLASSESLASLAAAVLDRSARAIRDEVAAGRVSAVEVCRAAIDRANAVNPTLNAFNLIAGERALARAEQIDRRRRSGETLGPLAGVPIALKDNMSVRGVRTTASSRILDTYVPPYDAT